MNRNRVRHAGVTLVEVMIAMLFATAVCAGLYKVGWQARRFAEHSRLATEARSLAKEKLEEITSHSLEDLKASDYWWNVETNAGATGFMIVRKPCVYWHQGDGSRATGSTNSVYAEVYVDVVFRSPLWGELVTNSFPIIVQ